MVAKYAPGTMNHMAPRNSVRRFIESRLFHGFERTGLGIWQEKAASIRRRQLGMQHLSDKVQEYRRPPSRRIQRTWLSQTLWGAQIKPLALRYTLYVVMTTSRLTIRTSPHQGKTPITNKLPNKAIRLKSVCRKIDHSTKLACLFEKPRYSAIRYIRAERNRN